MKAIIGVMGPGEEASNTHCQLAYELGKQIAAENWIVLTGGRNCGVMEAASKGAREKGGLTIGILPGQTLELASSFVDIPILTGMNEARNMINILSSHVIIACGMNPGTASEVALAIKAKKPVILLGLDEISISFFNQLSKNTIHNAFTVEQAINLVNELLVK